MELKTNFWGMNQEVPKGHMYSVMDDFKEAES